MRPKYLEVRVADLEAEVVRLETLLDNSLQRERRYVTLQISQIKYKMRRDRIAAGKRKPIESGSSKRKR